MKALLIITAILASATVFAQPVTPPAPIEQNTLSIPAEASPQPIQVLPVTGLDPVTPPQPIAPSATIDGPSQTLSISPVQPVVTDQTPTPPQPIVTPVVDPGTQVLPVLQIPAAPMVEPPAESEPQQTLPQQNP